MDKLASKLGGGSSSNKQTSGQQEDYLDKGAHQIFDPFYPITQLTFTHLQVSMLPRRSTAARGARTPRSTGR